MELNTLCIKRSRNIFSVLFCCFSICIFTSCENDLEEVATVEKRFEPSTEEGKGIKMFYSEDGAVKMELSADKIVRLNGNEPQTEFPEGVYIQFLNERKQTTSYLKSKYALRFEADKRTLFKDSVVFLSKAGEKLYTEELLWDEKMEQLSSPKYVQVVTPTDSLDGMGFEADQDFTNYRILKPRGITTYEDKGDENP